ncbi:MAG TPA: septum formation initiator family protein [Armatimonadota bacterium]|nr:septum formation initiator family protein [Armatimonadota bacterium]
MRIFLMLICISLAAFIVRAAVMKAARPYLISYTESKERADIQRQIAQANAEKNALKRDIAYLGTPKGKEEEARKLGWVKTGEVAVVVPDTGPSPFASEPLPQPSVWDRMSRRMAGMFVKGR